MSRERQQIIDLFVRLVVAAGGPIEALQLLVEVPDPQQLLRRLESIAPADAKQLQSSTMEPEARFTIEEMFELYMERHGNRARSAHGMRRAYDRHLVHFGQRAAVSLTTKEVHDLHYEIGARIGFATANHVLEILRAAYNKAIKWGVYDGANPCMAVTRFPMESRDRYLSRKDEIDRFLAALETMRSSTFRNFVKTCLFTAARVSNVSAMQWSELDFDLGVWRIPRTKSGKPVIVPLIDEAIAAIKAQEGRHSIWVFPSRRSKTGHIVNPSRAWRALLKKARIANLRMHDLRRTMGSWEANTGASLQIIQKTLGQSSTRATHIYARLQLEPVRKAMERAVTAMLRP